MDGYPNYDSEFDELRTASPLAMRKGCAFPRRLNFGNLLRAGWKAAPSSPRGGKEEEKD